MSAAIAVFAGPSIAHAEVLARLPGASVRPPVRLGDVLRALNDGCRTLVLIDGVFEQVPAVWHKEILLALSEGARVIGASSMGALRAAELDRLGMEGVGWVYAQYRDGLEDDDEVALLHADAEMGYANLSVPMIELRHLHASAPDAATRALLARLIESVKPVFYQDRTLEQVAARLEELGADAALRERLLARLADPAQRIKRLDAQHALEAARQPAPARPVVAVEHTIFLQQLRREVGTGEQCLQPRELLARALAALPPVDAGDADASARAQRLLRDWQRHKRLLRPLDVRHYLAKRQLDERALFDFLRRCARLDAGDAKRARAFLELI